MILLLLCFSIHTHSPYLLVSVCNEIFFSNHDRISYIFSFFNTDKSFNHRLAILKEVAKELADEGKPIFWIMDSFSTLVSNAVAKDAAPGSIANYKGVISQIFSLTSVLIPVPVCSSATTAGALADGIIFML